MAALEIGKSGESNSKCRQDSGAENDPFEFGFLQAKTAAIGEAFVSTQVKTGLDALLTPESSVGKYRSWNYHITV